MSDNNERGEWGLFTMETESGKRVYRIRLTPPKGLVVGEFAQGVIIEWRFADVGLPDNAASEQMRAFEEHMDVLYSHERNSILVHVYTGQGIREWCYYAKDYEHFMKELNNTLAGKPRYPIQILHQPDPTWKYWAQIKDFATQSGE